MSFLSFFTGIDSTKEQINQAQGAEDQVIFFLLSLIPQQEQVKPLLNQYELAKTKSGLECDLAYVTLYFTFEDFLTKNKPPIVMQSTNPEDLRLLISKKISVDNLPISFQAIFSKSGEQNLFLFELFTQYIIEIVINSIGVARFKQIAQTAVAGTYLSSALIFEGGIDFKGAQPNLLKLSETDLSASFSTFNKVFFQGISSCLGQVPATEFFYRSLEAVKKHYPLEFSSQVTPIIPPGVVKSN